MLEFQGVSFVIFVANQHAVGAERDYDCPEPVLSMSCVVCMFVQLGRHQLYESLVLLVLAG